MAGWLQSTLKTVWHLTKQGAHLDSGHSGYARGGASRLERTIQSDFLDLGGRPPLRFLRRACNCLKYSGPRLAISFPPFRPSLTAAGSFFFGKIQKMCVSSRRYYA